MLNINFPLAGKSLKELPIVVILILRNIQNILAKI